MIRALGALTLLGAAPVPAPVLGIDHVPTAVGDLAQAQAQFRALGFTLKPGRDHANGIRNAHAKFADGSYIELITAPAARDGLTARYRAMIAAGDGPAFLALLAPEAARLRAALARFGARITAEDGAPAFRDDDARAYLFFADGERSPTDRPEHYVHRNGAHGIAAVWLAPRDPVATRRDLVALGGRAAQVRVCTPDCGAAERIAFATSAVVILPARRARLPGRPIVGVTLSVDSVATARAALRAGGVPPGRIVARENSLFVPPGLANGMWLEFRPGRAGTSR